MTTSVTVGAVRDVVTWRGFQGGIADVIFYGVPDVLRTMMIGAALVATLTASTAWAADQPLKGVISDSMFKRSAALDASWLATITDGRRTWRGL